MAIEGPLRELGLHDVFQLLDLSRKTGVMRITSALRRNQGTVHFDSGAVVYAEIRSNPHPLGGLLLRSGKVTEGDLRLARDMQQRGDARRLGEILVGLGAITRRELERQVRAQVEEVIFEVMGWHEGHFSFAEGPLNDVGDAAVRIPTEALLMEGARRIDEWSRIERHIPHLGVIPSLAPATEGTEGELDLLPIEWEVLAAIDDARDIRAIAAALGGSEFEIAKIVFGLAAAGVLRVRDPGERALVTEEPDDVDELCMRVDGLLAARDVDGARSEAEAAVDAHPDEALAHLVLGRVYLAADRPREAEETARRALRLDPMMGPAHRVLGESLALQGRFAEAIEWWQRFLTLAREEGNGDADVVATAIEAARTLDSFLRRPHAG